MQSNDTITQAGKQQRCITKSPFELLYGVNGTGGRIFHCENAILMSQKPFSWGETF